MITKKSNERFVFNDGSFQDFPNSTTDQSVVIALKSDYKPPVPSTEDLFSSEMDSLNSEYDKAMNSLSVEYNIAMARDGSTETEKVEAIRGKITALDGKYETDKLAIINKYYGA